jgi:hypothetical protein
MPIVRLSKDQIDRIFDRVDNQIEPHQVDVLILLYKEVFPDWERIAMVDGFPRITERTSKYLFQRFIEFDDKHHRVRGSHKKVMLGGLWMDKGFSATEVPESLNDWEVWYDEDIIKYQQSA